MKWKSAEFSLFKCKRRKRFRPEFSWSCEVEFPEETDCVIVNADADVILHLPRPILESLKELSRDYSNRTLDIER